MHILLVDDHTLFREALLHVLYQLGTQIIVLEAANAEEATELITRSPNLDLVLLDIDLHAHGRFDRLTWTTGIGTGTSDCCFVRLRSAQACQAGLRLWRCRLYSQIEQWS